MPKISAPYYDGWEESLIEPEDANHLLTGAHDFYHFAPTQERNRILQHGLQVSYPQQSGNWSLGEVDSQPQGVYVTTSDDTGLFTRPMDKWKIPHGQIKELQEDPLIAHAYIIPHDIVQPELVEPYEDMGIDWSTHQQERYDHWGEPSPLDSHEQPPPNYNAEVYAKTASRWHRTPSGNIFWGPEGAAGILFHHPETNTYLLGHRSPEVHHGNTWGIPGGAIDEGESPYQAALREAQEEFGQVPQHQVVREHTSSPDPEWNYHTFVAHVPEQFDPEYAGDWETQDHGWFTPEQIAQLPLHPGFASTWNSGALQKQGGMTIPQEQRQWDELHKQYPSSAEVVHSFPNGWSIQHNPTKYDTWRVGKMMHNCWQHAPDAPFEGLQREGPRSTVGGLGTKMMSLHDENDIPRAAFFHAPPPKHPSPGAEGLYPGGQVNDLLAERNHFINPEHFEMINQWAEPNQILLDPDRWLSDPELLQRRVGKHGFFYHTAPSKYRQQIEEQGLVPTNEAPVSPWADATWEGRGDQPYGVYLWDDPINAHTYAYNLWHQDDKGQSEQEGYPGDREPEFDESYFETPEYFAHMEKYPGKRDEYNNPIDEDDYYDWENQYEPPHKPLYDIWKVNTLGYHPQIDPETAIGYGELDADEARGQIQEERSQYGQPDTMEGHRWYVPHAVEPQRLTLHHEVYPGHMTQNNWEELMAESKDVPHAWTRVPLEEWGEKARQRYLGDPNVMREIAPQDR